MPFWAWIRCECAFHYMNAVFRKNLTGVLAVDANHMDTASETPPVEAGGIEESEEKSGGPQTREEWSQCVRRLFRLSNTRAARPPWHVVFRHVPDNQRLRSRGKGGALRRPRRSRRAC